MTDEAETPGQGAVRVLAITGLVLTGLGAAFFFLATWSFSTDREAREYFGEPAPEVPQYMLGSAVAFVGACIATYGLVNRLPVLALVGAAGQASGAILFHTLVELSDAGTYLITGSCSRS